MKTMIVTTPIRPQPETFPPFGSLALIKYLRKNGIKDVEFYNIDGIRPRYEDVLTRIRESRPDILAISAVVSTAYEYSKRLSLDVKKMLPETLVVLGGNMAASANVLLHKTGVDLCVLGEGEKIFVDIVRRAEKTKDPADFADIPGLALLDRNGKIVNTGYVDPLPGADLYDIDWEDLKNNPSVEFFFPDPLRGELPQKLKHDPRVREPHRKGRRQGLIYTSKGCVSRCTFCHRWDKGIRFIPVEVLVARVREMVERYDVGFLHVVDENFGTDRRWLKEFCAAIKRFNLVWWCGTRVSGMTPEIIEMMKDSGCAAIGYGNETGSARMLEIMEKKVSLQDNYNTFEWTIKSGLYSVVQLVIGMPGECPETVQETIEYCKFATSLAPHQATTDLSINYAQALPGTPLYEFARAKNMIGQGLDGEEEYLLRISDRDAHDEYTTLNFTDFPKLMCETWRPLITIEVNHHYVRKYGLAHYNRTLSRELGFAPPAGKSDSGYYANPKRLAETASLEDRSAAALPPLWRLVLKGQWGLAIICHPAAAYRLRRYLLALVIVKNLREKGPWRTASMVSEYLIWRMRQLGKAPKFGYSYQSLRRILVRDIGTLPADDVAMAPLRRGR